LDPVVAIRG